MVWCDLVGAGFDDLGDFGVAEGFVHLGEEGAGLLEYGLSLLADVFFVLVEFDKSEAVVSVSYHDGLVVDVGDFEEGCGYSSGFFTRAFSRAERVASWGDDVVTVAGNFGDAVTGATATGLLLDQTFRALLGGSTLLLDQTFRAFRAVLGGSTSLLDQSFRAVLGGFTGMVVDLKESILFFAPGSMSSGHG